ncbi:MAG: cobalamin-dependent protein, partial [Candidatus Lokiarchaeota archaeon]
MEKTALVVLYKKDNIYSLNALIGALETNDDLSEIDVFFIRDNNKLINKLKQLIKSHLNILLAVSFFTTQIWQIKSLISKIRRKFGNRIIICAGGPHPTGRPKDTLTLGVDIVIMGEGENIFIQLIQKIHHNGDYSSVPGISYLNHHG